MGELTGKVAIVTGASKGIGAAIAKRLAAVGASVVVNYASSREGADRVVAEIAGKGGKAIAVKADVSKAVDVQRLFDATKKAFGSLDVLVNNAGVYGFAPLEEVTEDEFHREFNINVLGVLLASREAMKYFGRRRQRHQHQLDRQQESVTDGGRLLGDQGCGRHDHARAGKGAGAQENPGQRDQSGRRRDRGRAQFGDHRQRFRKRDGGAHPAGTLGAAGRHCVGRGVSSVRGLRLDDRGDDRGRRRLLVSH
jgi:NAD(P)-dependent dehydrogenase (short-subunit alcohol dehydrogenase family)